MRRFAAGLFDFVVGDDVWTALAVVVAVCGTALLERVGLAGWWLPVAVVPLATLRSLRSAARAGGPQARASR